MSPNCTTNSLLFSSGAVISYGGNRFINVPTILQVDGVSLIETVRNNEISRTTRFKVYHGDGVLLATVVGTCLFCTEEGMKAGLEMRYPSRATVCIIDGRIVFEVRRIAAAVLSITAELFSPAGLLIRSTSTVPFAIFGPDGTQLAATAVTDKRIRKTQLGYSVTDNGRIVAIGESSLG